MQLRRTAVLLAVLLGAALAATPAFASQLIARNAKHATLTIDSQGLAHVTYSSGGSARSVIASGAINARKPSTSVQQVQFRIRYGGGGGQGACLPYDGPPLAWLVKACKAPDGSYWALQSWQRLKPNFGGTTGAWELHLSHWTGALPELVVYQNWAPGGIRHIFGRLTYDGSGVFGFKSTPAGNPLDNYGRNIYLDTFNSGYGKGWHRETSFLTHHLGKTPGDFCYAFYRRAGHASGEGTKYRATVEGPGVTPDVMWSANDVGRLDKTVQSQVQSLERSWGDPKCRT